MTDLSPLAHPDTLRLGTPAALADALADARQHTLALVDALVAALGPGLAVRYLPELDPPLWLLGELAWREDWWISRNPLRLRGFSPEAAAAARAPAPLPRWDDCFRPDLTHPARWHQPLPDLRSTLRCLRASRERSLALLAGTRPDDTALQVYRAMLWHEDALRQDLLGLCQSLGVLPEAHGASPQACPATADELLLPAGRYPLGAPAEGYQPAAFGPSHVQTLEAVAIDRAPVSWARYLPFIEAGGYDEPRWWDRAGWAWRQRHGLARPRHLGRDEDGHWQLAQFGQWVPLDPRWPALHLSRHEALAWCRWAGRRLPTEFEWEAAARHAPAGEAFHWGQALEWTASLFAPLPGHEPQLPASERTRPEPAPGEPAPGEPALGVLRGASHLSAPRLISPWLRQAAAAGENAGLHGFRSCAGSAQCFDPAEPATAAPRPRGAARKRTQAAAPALAQAPAPSPAPPPTQVPLSPLEPEAGPPADN